MWYVADYLYNIISFFFFSENDFCCTKVYFVVPLVLRIHWMTPCNDPKGHRRLPGMGIELENSHL